MLIGVPKEIKEQEYRVGATPAAVGELVKAGHQVLVEQKAGVGSGFSDDEYTQQGAQLAETAKEVYGKAEMIYKVKEPLAQEYGLLREGQILYTYFHFAASQELTEAMMKTGAICLAYETVELPDGSLPLLTPMSEVAGRLAVQEGMKYLERPFGGRGVLLSGVPGVEPGTVVIIGGGVSGSNAARVAAGVGARVIIMDISVERLRYLAEVMPANVQLIVSNQQILREKIAEADLVIGAVLIHGARAPKLITRELLRQMKRGAVFVDISIDQGGIAETSRPTTHSNPTYEEEGVLHYCVANMPGAVSRTSTLALGNVTLPYALKIASLGWPACVKEDDALKKGVNVAFGKITYEAVAEAFRLTFTPLEKVVK